MKLNKASIIGYFSLPSPILAEHNPAAYYAALAEMPAGAGTCAHCGNGIRHHVIVREETGKVSFIGTTCAERCDGLDKYALRSRVTSEEAQRRREAREERWAKEDEERRQFLDALEEIQAQRHEEYSDILAMLQDPRTTSVFYQSLADQLVANPLSDRQAHYVAQLTSETGRRNKKNAAAWDAILDRVTDPDFPSLNHLRDRQAQVQKAKREASHS